MVQTIDAIYENGFFKPIDPKRIHISEGQRVTLVINEEAAPEALRLATQIYQDLSPQEIDEIEDVALAPQEHEDGCQLAKL